MRKVRIAAALLFFTAVTATMLDFTGTVAEWAGWTVKIQAVPAALAGSAAVLAGLVLATLLCGRVYCSAVCPLGVLQDIVRWLTFGRRRALKRGVPATARSGAVAGWTRISLLVLFVGGGLLGMHFAWLDPYGIYGRFAACLAPVVRTGNNMLADWAARHGSYIAHTVETAVPAVGFILVAAGTVAVVAVLAAWRGRREWCNLVCPVGTVLGALAKFAWFRPRIDREKCVKCGMCAKICRAGCIDVESGTFDRTKCVSCFDCSATCGKGAVKWTR